MKGWSNCRATRSLPVLLQMPQLRITIGLLGSGSKYVLEDLNVYVIIIMAMI